MVTPMWAPMACQLKLQIFKVVLCFHTFTPHHGEGYSNDWWAKNKSFSTHSMVCLKTNCREKRAWIQHCCLASHKYEKRSSQRTAYALCRTLHVANTILMQTTPCTTATKRAVEKNPTTLRERKHWCILSEIPNINSSYIYKFFHSNFTSSFNIIWSSLTLLSSFPFSGLYHNNGHHQDDFCSTC